MKFCLFLLLLFLPSTLSAQVLRGLLLDQESRSPIAFATLELLLGAEGSRVEVRALSDSSGFFLIDAEEPGRFRLRAERIGYQSVISPPFDLESSDTLEVELVASVEAVPLAPLTVISDRPPLVGNSTLILGGFRERTRIYGDLGLGIGHFVEKSEWDHRVLNKVSDLLRDMPGVRVWGGRNQQILLRSVTSLQNPRGCVPSFYLNGQLIRLYEGESIDALLPVSSIKALEIYPGLSRPAEFMDLGEHPCGSIVIWTG